MRFRVLFPAIPIFLRIFLRCQSMVLGASFSLRAISRVRIPSFMRLAILFSAGVKEVWGIPGLLCERVCTVLSTHLPTADGKMVHLRYCSIPTSKQVEVYSALKITSTPLKLTKVEM